MKQKCPRCLISVDIFKNNLKIHEAMENTTDMVLLKKYTGFGTVDKLKFKDLLEDAFSKKLVKDYFTYANPKLIIIADNDKKYLGAIVVEKIAGNIYYLDKIAVVKEFQRNGIGKKLWEELNLKSEKLVWRAKENNPINNFYQSRCEGMQKTGEWIIYWRGLTPKELEISIKYALMKKKTMEE